MLEQVEAIVARIAPKVDDDEDTVREAAYYMVAFRERSYRVARLRALTWRDEADAAYRIVHGIAP